MRSDGCSRPAAAVAASSGFTLSTCSYWVSRAVPRGLAVAELLRPDRPADGERGDDEGEPSKDGFLAVLGAPAPCTRGDVSRASHYPSCIRGLHGRSIRPRDPRAGGGDWRLWVWLSEPPCERVQTWRRRAPGHGVDNRIGAMSPRDD